MVLSIVFALRRVVIACNVQKLHHLDLRFQYYFNLEVLDGLRREFPFFLLKMAHIRGQLSDLGSHII